MKRWFLFLFWFVLDASHHHLFTILYLAVDAWSPDRHLGSFTAFGRPLVATVDLLQDVGYSVLVENKSLCLREVISDQTRRMHRRAKAQLSNVADHHFSCR